MTQTPPLSFVHRFEPGSDPTRPPILLLHGTGGDENDLLPLGRLIAPGSALLSPRGQVLERGMPRFFRRLSEGVFDEDDIRRRAGELADFIVEARKAYRLAAPIAVGFSNGANIAAAVLLLRPEALDGAVLLRAMAPFRDPSKVDLTGKPVLLISGASDPIAPAETVARLVAALSGAGAAVRREILPSGHQLTEMDVALAKDWLARL
ncbi:alpha/beta hydrolase [Methylocapsa sp. S129]|uniref:alpha/beta hydrolase n=1 Tax=Methylocapsa sp. S129 TaxID=1641869 RepID=UPI00131D9E31|nr:alpha/beta hydrolase [Methylocapsa sp. S129]